MNITGRFDFGFNIQEVKDFYLQKNLPEAKRRKKIMATTIFAMAISEFTLLKQTGNLKELPDLPYPIFDANKITTSLKAYEFGLPDATLALLLYSAILVIAGYEGAGKFKRPRMMDQLLLLAAGVHSAAGLQYFLNMIFKQKKICAYCITVTLTNFKLLELAYKNLNSRTEGDNYGSRKNQLGHSRRLHSSRKHRTISGDGKSRNSLHS